MEKRETLTAVDSADSWQAQVRTLLDIYLRAFGIRSQVLRTRWTNRVVDDLVSRAEHVAMENMLEEAVEHMRDLIEARIAMVCNHDPAHEHKEVAQVMVVLLNEKYSDCLNLLFEHTETEVDLVTMEKLRHALAMAMPMPVPADAPMAMPVQTIELRSINPLRRLFGRSA